jgi:hypothetical protein
MHNSTPGQEQALLTVRSAVVFAAGLLVATLAAALMLMTGASLPEALLTAGSAFGGAVVVIDQMIERPTNRRR